MKQHRMPSYLACFRDHTSVIDASRVTCGPFHYTCDDKYIYIMVTYYLVHSKYEIPRKTYEYIEVRIKLFLCLIYHQLITFTFHRTPRCTTMFHDVHEVQVNAP
jgi:hypothetical protein